jgi:hypothetical protein
MYISHSASQKRVGQSTVPPKYGWDAMRCCISQIFIIIIIIALQSLVGSWLLFQFLSVYEVGNLPSTGDQPFARPLPTRRTTQTETKRPETSMPWMGIEPTIPVFERVRTVHALDCAATVIGHLTTSALRMCAFCPKSIIKDFTWYSE